MACWYRGNKKVVASLAEGGNKADRHSEDFILNHIDKIHSEHDKERDLVIISTASPCKTCFEKELIQKMCNGINPDLKKRKQVWVNDAWQWVLAANDKPRFRKCYYLFSIEYTGQEQDWDSTIVQEYGDQFLPVKCNKPPSKLNPYLNKPYKFEQHPLSISHSKTGNNT